MKKPKRILISLTVMVMGIITSMALHIIASKLSTESSSTEMSFLVENLGLELTLILWYILSFGAVVYLFYRLMKMYGIESREVGIRYGLAVALLWLIGMLEGVTLFGNPFLNEFVTGLCDAIPILLMILVLTRLLPQKKAKPINVKAMLQTLLIFTTVFVSGRVMFYGTGLIHSGLGDRPLGTILWTIAMGLVIGFMFHSLCLEKWSMKQGNKVVLFSCIIFGLNWAVFNMFMPFLFSGALLSAIIRVVMDTVLVTGAAFLCMLIKSNQ